MEKYCAQDSKDVMRDFFTIESPKSNIISAAATAIASFIRLDSSDSGVVLPELSELADYKVVGEPFASREGTTISSCDAIAGGSGRTFGRVTCLMQTMRSLL
jgi:hypothetical protein